MAGHHPSLEPDRFALVFLHLLGEIPVPNGKIGIRDLDDRCFDIKGKRVLDLIVIKAAVHIVIADFGAAADPADHLVDLHFIGAHRRAVQQDHLAAGQLIHHQAAHIGVIA